MKKVLLSFLLALLCNVRASSQPNPCHNQGVREACISVINGVQYFVLTFNCLPPGSTTSLQYQSTLGWTTYYTPTITSTSTSGEPILYYPVDPSWPITGGCVDYNWWNSTSPGSVPGTACPCKPCDANFSYCVAEDPNNPGQWLVTFSLLNPPSWYNAQEYHFGDGTSYITGGVYGYAVTHSYSSGTYTVCVKNWYDEVDGEDFKATRYCEKCFTICLPNQLKPAQAPTAVGQANAYFSEVKVYPNPASNSAKLQFSMKESDQLNIQLVDMSGRTLKTLRNEQAASGYYTIEINTSDLPSGMYIIRMETGKTSANYRLSVIK